MIPEPRITAEMEDNPPETKSDYAKVLRTLAGQLGVMNDYYMPLIDVAVSLERDR